MKKTCVAILVALMVAVANVGFAWNVQIFDFNFHFNKAIIAIGSETIEIDVKEWREYDESDAIQITAIDGTVYYTHLTNVVMMNN